MLLNIVPCTGRPPAIRKDLVPNVKSAEAEQPCANRIHVLGSVAKGHDTQ